MRCEDWKVSYREAFLVPKKDKIWRSNLCLFQFCQNHTFTLQLEQNTYKDEHTDITHNKDYFQVKFYIHDCYAQQQYVALGVLDH
jgi:hypothetical protein